MNAGRPAADLVIFHNTLDISDIVRQLVAEGRQLTSGRLSQIAPFRRAHISRFGAYATDDLRCRPDPLDPLLKEADFTGDGAVLSARSRRGGRFQRRFVGDGHWAWIW
ncbi:Tn3 family transposase [Nonomuraea sp. NPDC049480]|uniref:Tn3 family transposase n=1 Tax=Nonomuraea sp. NPDC049480 TaxID=3364353 RepID=UPI0037A2456E